MNEDILPIVMYLALLHGLKSARDRAIFLVDSFCALRSRKSSACSGVAGSAIILRLSTQHTGAYCGRIKLRSVGKMASPFFVVLGLQMWSRMPWQNGTTRVQTHHRKH